jgi:hypothetical protein
LVLTGETVILGGHIDSTAGGASNRSPGADDDASGSAAVLEVFKILMASGFVPDRTVEFHAYAAEEVSAIPIALYQKSVPHETATQQLEKATITERRQLPTTSRFSSHSTQIFHAQSALLDPSIKNDRSRASLQIV